jgi:hypothetical protein
MSIKKLKFKKQKNKKVMFFFIAHLLQHNEQIMISLILQGIN